MDSFFERPILNSPYGHPGRHWELDDDGQPTNRIVDSRRRSELITPVPKPQKRRRTPNQAGFVFDSGEGLSTEEQEYNPTPIINEVATLCERVGADAAEVARGLKSDRRIGSRAYLTPGAAFAGGTLARDVMFLDRLADEHGRRLHLIPAVRASNDAHRQWAAERLESELGDLAGKTVAVGADHSREPTRFDARAVAVPALASRGVTMRAFDPSITRLPPDVAVSVTLAGSPTEAARGADAVVVATEWPVFREIAVEDLMTAGAPVVLDASRFLASTLGADGRLRYLTVGSPR